MMNSRGVTSPEVAALQMLYDLLELAKRADLPAHIAQLREAEKAEREAAAALDKKTSELDAREKALHERAGLLETREKQSAERETACASKEEATSRREATFVAQRAALAEQKREVGDQVNLLTADRTAFEAHKLLRAAAHEAVVKADAAEADRLHRESHAAIQALRDGAAADIREWRANAEADMAIQRHELSKRETTLASREDELHRERARLSALLQG